MDQVPSWNNACDDREPQHIIAHQDAISFCGFLNDSTIVTSSHDKTLALWELYSGKKLTQLCEHDNRVVACAIDKKGSNNILSGSWDKKLVYWDVELIKPLWIGWHKTLVTSCDMHSESFLAISGCDNGTLIYWDTRSGKDTQRIEGHGETITSCKFSNNGLNICTTLMNGAVFVWDVRTQRKLLKFRDHTNAATSCAFSNNNLHLVTTSWDKTIRLYDVSSGSYRLKGPIVLKHHEGCVSFSTFSDDDTLLVSCGYDKIINVWDMNTCSLKNSYRGHKSWIYCCQFSECTNWIISGSKEGEMRLFDTTHEWKVQHSDHAVDLVKCYECGLLCPKEENIQQNLQCVFCRLKT